MGAIKRQSIFTPVPEKMQVLIALVIIALAGFSTAVFGQFGMLTRGRQPIQLGVNYDYFDTPGMHQVTGTFSRAMETGLLPNRSPFSRISALNLAVGILFDADTSEFRWRAGLMEMDFRRRYLAFGVTILDFNKAGRLQDDYRWVNLRFGPGISLRKGKFSLYPQIQGMAGPSRVVLGKVNFPKLGAVADSTLSGLEVGYRAALAIRLGRRIILFGDYRERIFTDAPEPRFKIFSAETQLILGKFSSHRVKLFLGYWQERVEINNSVTLQENRYFQTGVRLLLKRPARKEFWWDE